MQVVKKFNNFINEKDKKEGKKKELVPTIDKDTERLKSFTIDGKSYEGVLSTFKAIAEKQKAMGEKEVGIISLPGENAAYELFLKEGEEEKEEEDSKEEKGEKGDVSTKEESPWNKKDDKPSPFDEK